eukprot:6922959-Prymnesium_polylepis.1
MVAEYLHLQAIVAWSNTCFLFRAEFRDAILKLATFGIQFDKSTDLGVDKSAGGLICSSASASSWAGGRTNFGFPLMTMGLCYFEATQVRSITIQTGKGLQERSPGLMRIGWATRKASLALGTDSLGFGYGGTGKKSHRGEFTEYGERFSDGDTIGCLLDGAERSIAFSKNGSSLGVAFTVPRHLDHEILHPAICLKGCMIQLTFGPGFRYDPPRGYRLPYPLPSHEEQDEPLALNNIESDFDALKIENEQLRAELVRLRLRLADSESLLEAMVGPLQLDGED